MTPCTCPATEIWVTEVRGADMGVKLGNIYAEGATRIERYWIVCTLCGAEWVMRDGIKTGVLDATIEIVPTDGS